jgi:hypothetical protein
MLATLHRVGVHCLPAGGSPLIAEVEEHVRFQSLLSADPRSSIKAAIGEPCPERQELLKETERKALAERETRWIAEYDAQFLSSMRIQFISDAPTAESLRSFPGGSIRDSRAVDKRRT